jgi:hypothetical protein
MIFISSFYRYLCHFYVYSYLLTNLILFSVYIIVVKNSWTSFYAIKNVFFALLETYFADKRLRWLLITSKSATLYADSFKQVTKKTPFSCVWSTIFNSFKKYVFLWERNTSWPNLMASKLVFVENNLFQRVKMHTV